MCGLDTYSKLWTCSEGGDEMDMYSGVLILRLR